MPKKQTPNQKRLDRQADRLLASLRKSYHAAIRVALSLRDRNACDDRSCPGYIVSVVDRFPGVEIEVCDQCAPKGVTDDDVAALPEAQKLLAEHPDTQDE